MSLGEYHGLALAWLALTPLLPINAGENVARAPPSLGGSDAVGADALIRVCMWARVCTYEANNRAVACVCVTSRLFEDSLYDTRGARAIRTSQTVLGNWRTTIHCSIGECVCYSIVLAVHMLERH